MDGRLNHGPPANGECFNGMPPTAGEPEQLEGLVYDSVANARKELKKLMPFADGREPKEEV